MTLVGLVFLCRCSAPVTLFDFLFLKFEFFHDFSWKTPRGSERPDLGSVSLLLLLSNIGGDRSASTPHLSLIVVAVGVCIPRSSRVPAATGGGGCRRPLCPGTGHYRQRRQRWSWCDISGGGGGGASKRSGAGRGSGGSDIDSATAALFCGVREGRPDGDFRAVQAVSSGGPVDHSRQGDLPEFWGQVRRFLPLYRPPSAVGAADWSWANACVACLAHFRVIS